VETASAPQISAARTSANRRTGFGGVTAGDFVLPLDLSYEVDLWGRIRRTIASAREQFQASAADLENARLFLIAQLVSDYVQLRSLDRESRILNESVAAYSMWSTRLGVSVCDFDEA